MAEDKLEIAVGAAVLALAVGFIVYTARHGLWLHGGGGGTLI